LSLIFFSPESLFFPFMRFEIRLLCEPHIATFVTAFEWLLPGVRAFMIFKTLLCCEYLIATFVTASE
jgi:hypothetical protein